MKDLTGNKYGKLTVVNFSHSDKRRRWWHCVCECGGTKTVNTNQLSSGHTSSCGCVKPGPNSKFKGMVGKKYNYLTVIKYLKSDKNNQRVWKCRCDCGKQVEATTSDLNKGRKKSCGCFDKEARENRNEAIVYLYENHLTYDEVRDVLRCESKSITNALNKAGIARTRGHNFRTPEQKQHAYRIMYGE